MTSSRELEKLKVFVQLAKMIAAGQGARNDASVTHQLSQHCESQFTGAGQVR
jgi:hypothetical protein